VVRVAGPGRVETAVEVSRRYWQTSGRALLATADRYPDALAGGALAAELDAPLLLTTPGSLHPAVEAELLRLDAETVTILGGTSAVSQAVENRLEALDITVDRIAGEDRYATAAAVDARVPLPATGQVALASGDNFPDAVSAGALSASPSQVPTLLTRAGDLPPATEQALEAAGAREILLLGGTVAISADVEARLDTLGYTVRRLSGPTRYDTSVAVVAEAARRYPAGTLPVVFASGENFPDALAAGALAARLGALLLLVHRDTLANSPASEQFLRDFGSSVSYGVVVGGPAAVSEVTLEEIRALVAPE